MLRDLNKHMQDEGLERMIDDCMGCEYSQRLTSLDLTDHPMLESKFDEFSFDDEE